MSDVTLHTSKPMTRQQSHKSQQTLVSNAMQNFGCSFVQLTLMTSYILYISCMNKHLHKHSGKHLKRLQVFPLTNQCLSTGLSQWIRSLLKLYQVFEDDVTLQHSVIQWDNTTLDTFPSLYVLWTPTFSNHEWAWFNDGTLGNSTLKKQEYTGQKVKGAKWVLVRTCFALNHLFIYYLCYPRDHQLCSLKRSFWPQAVLLSSDGVTFFLIIKYG